MTVDSSRDRVAERYVRIDLAVLQRYLELLHEVVERLLVLVDVSEVEVYHLEHCLNVLRGRVARNVCRELSECEVCVGNLACESLLQLCRRECAETAVADHLVEECEVGEVLGAVECRTTQAAAAEEHLILLVVGLHKVNDNAVRECECSVAELLVLHFLLHLASLRHGSDERFVLHVVYVSLNLLSACVLDSAEQLSLSRVNVALSLVQEREHDEVGVVSRHELSHHLVSHLNRHSRYDLAHSLILEVDRRHRVALKEVVYEVAVELTIATLVLVAVFLLECALVVLLEACILCSCEAEASGAQSLCVSGLKRSGCLAEVLRRSRDVEGVLGLGEDECAVVSVSAYVRALRIESLLLQAVVEHSHGSLLSVVVDEVAEVALLRSREHVVLDHELYAVGLLLLVLVDDNDRLSVVGHLLVYDRSGVSRVLERTEELLDLALCVLDVYVAHNDDGLVCRVIPLLVVVAQFFRLEVVDDRHQTDRIAHAVLRARVELRQVALEHAA